MSSLALSSAGVIRRTVVTAGRRHAYGNNGYRYRPGGNPGAAARSSHALAPLAVAPLLALGELHRLARCDGASARPAALRRRSTFAVYAEPALPSSLSDDATGAARTLGRRLSRLRKRARRTIRMLVRAAQLLITAAPLAALYPVARALKSLGLGGPAGSGSRAALEEALGAPPSDDSAVTQWYLKLTLWAVESSGAAVIKLCQWASSRPDMFGQSFCDVFGKLQDATTPHHWKHTEKILRASYGEEWEKTVRLGGVLGSGCIGQVYKGAVTDSDGKERNVAVKVMHPGVRSNIDADLDLLYLFADIAERLPRIGPKVKWLDLPGVVDEFQMLLKHQLDFRVEAKNLERFNENFKDDDEVLFPQLIPGFDPKKDILIETFCDGVPMMKWNERNMANIEKRRKMCDVGVRTVCDMIFRHNFIHGDLHPGNIFISPDGDKFILLDTGMAATYSEADHDRIVSILTAMIRMDGQRAGELLIKDSNARTKDDNKVLHESQYITKIKALTEECKNNPDEYLMQKLGEYISYIFDAAQTHHVMMNPAFVSCASAVKVVEGVALALDHNCEIWRVANPIILQAELARNGAKIGAFLGVGGVINKASEMYYTMKYKYKDFGK